MNITQFIEFVENRFEPMYDNYKKSYERILKTISSLDLDDLKEYVAMNVTGKYAPKPEKIEAIIQELGIKQTSSGDIADSYFWKICSFCGSSYSKNSPRCPECTCEKADYREGGQYPNNLVKVQDGCSCCSLYENKGMGPTCKSFGKPGVKLDWCPDCICLTCCSYHKIMKTDFERSRKMSIGFYNRKMKSYNELKGEGK